MSVSDLAINGTDLGIVLRRSTMLAQLTTRKWSASRNDDRAVADIRRAKGATGHVGRFHKNLLAGVDQPLKAINSLMQQAYNEHRSMTLPWIVEGQRLLAVEKTNEYLGRMNKFVVEMQPLVDGFCNQYDALVRQAEQNLGELFNSREYPPAGAIRGMFKIDVSLQPVPSTTDWQQLSGINERTLQVLGHHTQQKIREACSGARDELRLRAQTWAERAVKSLVPKEDDPSKPAVMFHSTLLTDLHQTVKDLETMNFSQDPSCNEMVAVLKPLGERLGDDVKELREHPDLREWVVLEARRALFILGEYQQGEAA
jgi:hypothetical protein